ncbi:MAG: HlyD family efflux transporter periplasmic adaptor subunit [candidate division Zixibacteria bacterium]|nr:HlyD family efflux transporter periplasmic adaptor subunit [candidate division Zixibacteria bacterium]
MLNNKTTIIAVCAIIAVGFLLGGVLGNQKKPMRMRPTAPSTGNLTTMSVHNGDVSTRFTAGGTLHALDKIDIYAEVTGVLLTTDKPFKAGRRYRAGEVIIHIDDEVYHNTLLAEKSNLLNQLTQLLPDLELDFPESVEKWTAFLNDFDLHEPLKPLPEAGDDRERNYIAARNIYSKYYSVKSMRATLDKYTIRAPYDGVVTESDINPGMLVRNGQKLGEFTGTGAFELEASVGINDVGHLHIGDRVTLTSDDVAGEFPGTIERINEKIDQSSQTVMIYIITEDKRLKDGMYITAEMSTIPIPDAIQVSRELLVGGDRLYTIQDDRLVLQKVEVMVDDNDQVVVTGLADGTVLLTEVVEDAYDGMPLKNDPVEPTTDENNK